MPQCSSRAQVANVQLFDLSVDPSEKINLVKGAGAGSCCRPGVDAPLQGPEGRLASACYEAALYPGARTSSARGGNRTEGGDMGLDRAMVVCCHLETAAVAFASDNLAFFGRH